MYRRQIIKDRIYYLIQKITENNALDKQCEYLARLGVNHTKLHTLILEIEKDFDISLELQEDYTGITTIDILCNLIEIEIYSKW